jgi:hypothetical protein
MVSIRNSHTGIIDRPLIRRIVEIRIVMRERGKLRALGCDLARRGDLVPLRLEDVDLGCAATLCDGGTGVVGAWAGTGTVDGGGAVWSGAGVER